MKKRYLIIFTFIIIILIFCAFSYKSQSSDEPQEPVNLNFWGFEKHEKAWNKVITAFSNKYPHNSIYYKPILKEDYKLELGSAMAESSGPDILMVQSGELRNFKDKIAPFPNSIITLKKFQKTFAKTAQDDLILENQIYALPNYIDVLSLYYNKDIFESQEIPSPPKTWREFNNIVKKITEIDDSGKIILSGTALGQADNVSNSADILSMLMLQQGTNMLNPSKTQAAFNQSVNFGGEIYYPGERALEFYTSYANRDRALYTWDKAFNSSIKAFANNKVSMIFGFLSDRKKILSFSKDMNFGISPIPQIAGTPIDINYAKYDVGVVSKVSLHQAEAFKFLDFASSPEGAKIFIDQAVLPTARKDLVTWQTQNPEIGNTVPQILTAKTWYQRDSEAVGAIFSEMISSYLAGKSGLKEAVDYGADKVSALMR